MSIWNSVVGFRSFSTCISFSMEDLNSTISRLNLKFSLKTSFFSYVEYKLLCCTNKTPEFSGFIKIWDFLSLSWDWETLLFSNSFLVLMITISQLGERMRGIRVIPLRGRTQNLHILLLLLSFSQLLFIWSHQSIRADRCIIFS